MAHAFLLKTNFCRGEMGERCEGVCALLLFGRGGVFFCCLDGPGERACFFCSFRWGHFPAQTANKNTRNAQSTKMTRHRQKITLTAVGQCNAPCVQFLHSGFSMPAVLDQAKGLRHHFGPSCATCLQKSTYHTTAAQRDSCSPAKVAVSCHCAVTQWRCCPASKLQ